MDIQDFNGYPGLTKETPMVGVEMHIPKTPRRKVIICLSVTAVVLLACLLYGRSSTDTTKVELDTAGRRSKSNSKSGFLESTTGDEKNTTKLILWYLRPNYVKPTNEGELRPLMNCPHLNCRETSDVKLLPRADAVVFDVHRAIRADNKPPRYPKQTWVFYAQESPVNVRSTVYRMDRWRASFNWTCTYRRDSDVWMPYGIIRKSSKLPVKDYHKIAESKTKMAGWALSHCSSQGKREVFAKRLVEQGIQVEIFGGCGKKCGSRSKVGSQICEDLASRNYSFYLAFENSLCKDYVTEKFFHMYNKDVILVARGGVQFLESLPKGTFINTDDFTSVKDLAAYLKRLHNDKTEYINFLKRKDEFIGQDESLTYKLSPTSFWTHYHYISEPVCDMCRKLLDIDNNRNTYPDIYQWYNEDTCVPPTDL
ncbi:alpha-(1,3)-fucosyltransferase C-like [Haliotis rubra]|uniref:alpha-(1,3)-fucosyltransferase C-like n=1 Tax=Haliotis rubra TaxID=36100 RepID=UPI001EE5123E|nr:alpha-(1,3)-fucosyltransferase C-like [Haliotis rubra]